MAETQAPEVDYTLNNPDTLTKYKTAAQISHKVLEAVSGWCLEGAKIVELCQKGDQLLEEEIAKVYKGKKVSKGFAHPTTVSPSSYVTPYTPLLSDAEEANTTLKAGEVVKIQLGAQIDGFGTIVCDSIVVAGAEDAVTGREADLLLATHYANELLLRLMVPPGLLATGSEEEKQKAAAEKPPTQTQISNLIEKVAKAYDCNVVENTTSWQFERNEIEGKKKIILSPGSGTKGDGVPEVGEVWGVEIGMSLGSGKVKTLSHRATLHRRTTTTYILKRPSSRQTLSEIVKKFGTFPFSLRQLDDEKAGKVGVVECVRGGVVRQYEPAGDSDNAPVARLLTTIAITKNGITKLAAPPEPDLSKIKSDKKIEDEEILKILERPISKSTGAKGKKNKKKKKPAKTAQGEGEESGDEEASRGGSLENSLDLSSFPLSFLSLNPRRTRGLATVPTVTSGELLASLGIVHRLLSSLHLQWLRTSAPPPAPDSARPRKQRRTGRTSRIGVESAQDEPREDQGQHELPGAAGRQSTDVRTPTPTTDWTEPPLRAAAPSYVDTPWSAVSSSANPVLSDMRPLGAMPNASDLRKAGLSSSTTKTTPRYIIVKKRTNTGATVANGNHVRERPKSASASTEEPAKGTANSKPSANQLPENTTETDAFDLRALPVPHSAQYNVEKIKSVVENALRLAEASGDRAVARGLRRLWTESDKNGFFLSVLDGVARQQPADEHKSAFQGAMREAFKSLRAEEQSAGKVSTPPRTRTRSATATSSLSSAKSLDADTFAPAMGAGEKPPPKPKGKGKEPLLRSTALPASEASQQRKRARQEDPEFSEEAIAEKKSRLRRTFSDLVARESRLRSSLGPESRSSPGPESGTPNGERVRDPRTRGESQDNNDFCRQCGRSGQLLCCDGCVNSYHFSCLAPPLDPANLPEGKWFCPSCSMSGPFGALLEALDKAPERDFQLPLKTRTYFEGVKTGEDGRYEEVHPRVKNTARARGGRYGFLDDQYRLRLFDSKNKLIVCVACGRTTNGVRPIVQCDYCPCAFHMDCVDPPLAIPPPQKPGSDKAHHNWMCPNHVEHELYKIAPGENGYGRAHRIRRPRHPRVVDVDVLPEDSEAEELEEQESQGIVYRVSEKGLKLNFIERIKRENLEAEIRAAGAAQYSEYARKKLDHLVEQATAFYASQPPTSEVFDNNDAAADVLASRSAADREAAMNLASFAQGNQATTNLQPDKIGTLIDQLRANAPKDLPKAETELESLHALQELINRRIQTLTGSSSD
ncbi:hypothetical protein DTO212C5_9230 [Paecilomyces variotii]|nr:hypothetical protein DTO212C5_9230 [Paecilomyces variotii]